MDAVAALMFLGVFTLTLLPLVVILPSSPPMTDPDNAPSARQNAGQNKLCRVAVAPVHIWRDLWTKVWANRE